MEWSRSVIKAAKMPQTVLDRVNMDIVRLMWVVYGGWPTNLRYDPFRRVYVCDIIKVGEDPCYIEDGVIEDLLE